jgi:hypothetical protein
MKIALYVAAFIAFIVVAFLVYDRFVPQNGDERMCAPDTVTCADGTIVGRIAPTCEFEACPVVENGIPDDVQAHIDSKANLIRVTNPAPYEVIESPLTITGEARGYWYFEATFPIVLVNWNGLIVAEGFATADGEWMTENFVPFTATLTFTKPDFDNRGTLILQRSNASGLPEHDDALEIPIRFDEGELEVQ